MGSPRFKSTGPGITQERVYRSGTSSTQGNSSPEIPPLDLPDPLKGTSALQTRESIQSISYEVQPGYFKKVRQGEILAVQPKTTRLVEYSVINDGPYTFRRNDRRRNGTSWSHVRYAGVFTGVPFNLVGGTPNWNTVPPYEPLVVEAIANLRSELWDIGTTLAEAGKSIDTILGFATNLRKRRDVILGIMLKRRSSQIKKQDYFSFFREFSSMWLEARYGWRPMYYDVMDAYQAYQRIGTGSLLKRRSETDSAGKVTESDWLDTPLSGCQYKSTSSSHSETRAFCGGMLDMNRPVSVDPFVTLWEVVPFSFISDWIFNIGSNIQAFSPLAAGDLKFVGFSQQMVITTQLDYRVKPPQSGYERYYIDQNLPTAIYMRKYSRRLPVTKPAFSFNFRPNFSWAKVVDLAAIGVSLKTGVFKAYSQRR